MKYEVLLLPLARHRIVELHALEIALAWTRNKTSAHATRWLDNTQRALESLSATPESHSVAHEDADFPITLRQLNFGLGGIPSHRALFSIQDEKVLVFTVRSLSAKSLELISLRNANYK